MPFLFMASGQLELLGLGVSVPNEIWFGSETHICLIAYICL